MRALLICLGCLISWLLASSASAVWTTVNQTTLAGYSCPPFLGVGFSSGPDTPVDELGLSSAFPAGEQIATSAATTSSSTCGPTDDTQIPNALVSITNQNEFRFRSLFYMPSVGTTMTAADTMFNGMPVLFIGNHPGTVDHQVLVSESILPDGIFEPGETWTFIIQDYSNAALLPADAIGAIGVPDAIGASGSIIALYSEIVPVVPEPGTGLLVIAGLLGLGVRRRGCA
jgi:hypothetical protein